MPTITANHCEMFYDIDDFTDPWVKDKETVWLQHGVGRSTKFWYHWVPALARQYRVLRRDMRGHGQSADPGPDHRWSLDELVTDMREFMDAMGLHQVHYLGEFVKLCGAQALFRHFATLRVIKIDKFLGKSDNHLE